ncbi:transcriptional regulator [Halostella sp. PRR32]|uniref:transcriptional regulator n=1 Tax=Halostella sp. PRR32 TaxID=3098147 RepID=UPI002B1E20CE|nr:transcriptional regulator [Halostella sp. PRR32]
MNEVDDSILEFFNSQGDQVSLPPTAVWYNLAEIFEVTDKSRDTVARRMRGLDKAGLLEKVDEQRGYYRITDKGGAYLSGDIDAEDLEREKEGESD